MSELKILFEDADIIVCTKPRGVLSQSDEHGGKSMVTLIEERISADGTKPYVAVVHRLDTAVGGVMVYAKSKPCAAKLSACVCDKELFKKQYIAVICGKPEEARGVYRDLLFKDTHLSKSFVVDKMRKGVKEASLEYETLGYNEKEDLSLVKITLHTGRTHQIRVQFSSRKTPLSGDKKYGARDGRNMLALWSYSLSFFHPSSKKPMSFCALPDENEGIWQLFDLKELLR